MKKVLFLLAITVLSTASYSQGNINRGDWLVGGEIGFESRSLKSSSGTSSKGKEFYYNLSPNAAYFFLDKLAGGIRLTNAATHYNYEGSQKYKIASAMVGPFIRYYFLPSSGDLNLFVDGSYTLGNIRYVPEDDDNDKQKYKMYAYNVKAGAAYFIAPEFALEFTANYMYRKDTDEFLDDYSDVEKRFSFLVGFNIYLSGRKASKAK